VINIAVSTISRDWWVDINLAVVSLWFNFSLRTSAKIWVRPLHRKLCVNIASENNISPIFPDTPTGVLGRSLWVWHDIADVIEHGKFCFKRFRSFGDLTPKSPFSTGCPTLRYVTVTMLTLHVIFLLVSGKDKWCWRAPKRLWSRHSRAMRHSWRCPHTGSFQFGLKSCDSIRQSDKFAACIA